MLRRRQIVTHRSRLSVELSDEKDQEKEFIEIVSEIKRCVPRLSSLSLDVRCDAGVDVLFLCQEHAPWEDLAYLSVRLVASGDEPELERLDRRFRAKALLREQNLVRDFLSRLNWKPHKADLFFPFLVDPNLMFPDGRRLFCFCRSPESLRYLIDTLAADVSLPCGFGICSALAAGYFLPYTVAREFFFGSHVEKLEAERQAAFFSPYSVVRDIHLLLKNFHHQEPRLPSLVGLLASSDFAARHGESLNLQHPLTGDTLLHIAARNNVDQLCVSLLIDHLGTGRLPDPNVRNNAGQLAIDVAHQFLGEKARNLLKQYTTDTTRLQSTEIQ